MTEFVPPRDRDATASIRGFVYQVDLTITRWLALDSDSLLELECGEDIDQIVQNLAAPADETRRLEQIKVRGRPITLRSSDAVESLANAAHHIERNPGISLHFQFTTTATIGRERPHPRLDLPHGIALWEEARVGEGAPPDAHDVLRAIVQSASRPSALPAPPWAALETALSDEDRWRRLVSRFEWSTGQPTPDRLSQSVIDNLVAAGFTTADMAPQIYEQLFLHVFRLLARDGRKRLSAVDLRAELQRDRLNATDKAFLRELRRRLLTFDVRVDALEQQMQAVGDAVTVMAQRLGIPTSPLVTAAEPDVEPPPMVQHISRRARTVAVIADGARGRGWLALYGPIGIGKTHLAQLVGDSLN